MTKIVLSGCNGRMGQAITRLAEETQDLKIVAGIDITKKSLSDFPVFATPAEVTVAADVIIDFSLPDALPGLVDYALRQKLGLVMATTGHSEAQLTLLSEAAVHIPVFKTGNMSLGINLLIDLVQRAAKVLEENYDIELIEKHHNQKLDAPSGTALMIADAINVALAEKKTYVYERESKRDKRDKQELGIHSLRGGTFVGEHTVVFAGFHEVIEITHTAYSRELFAIGALKAAQFLPQRGPGFYDMRDLLS